MLLIENLSEKQLQDVRIACSYLFSPELARDDEFVINLDVASINKALKEKKKRYDPAHHPDESEEMILKRKERFIKIKQSYEILMPYIFEEEKIIPEQDSRKNGSRPADSGVKRRKMISIIKSSNFNRK